MTGVLLCLKIKHFAQGYQRMIWGSTYRGREAPEKPTGVGGPGGLPPEMFLKKQVNGANLDHPGYFFNKLLSMKLIPFYTVIDARKTNDLYSRKRKGLL